MKPSQTVPTVHAAFEIADLLAEARVALARAAVEQARANYRLTVVKAVIEQIKIEAVGGEKQLGANEDARKRNLLLSIEQSAGYTAAHEDALAADLYHRMAEAEVRALSDQFSIVVSALDAGILDLPAGLLDAGLDDEPIPFVLTGLAPATAEPAAAGA